MKSPILSRQEQKNLVKQAKTEWTVLSFYRYTEIKNPVNFADRLREGWSALGVLGRIYVAREGINAQLSVPKQFWSRFDAFVQSLPELADMPYKFAVDSGAEPAFYKLTVKVKDKIVADGITDHNFDAGKTGSYLSASQFNDYIDDSDKVVVDMRNSYESEVGHFSGAVTPDVDTFRQGIKVLPKLLSEHKNKPIALYCTGGIRCEKASAWLLHHGFAKVSHLKGGIIDYKQQVDRAGLKNKFRGKNFVFDERLGERINEEVIATCHLCGVSPADTHYHCHNQACHILFIGCDACLTKRRGYCSYRCLGFNRLPKRFKKFLVRRNNKRKPPQFKKHRLRLN